MGRGNVCVMGTYEGLYYVDRDRIDMYRDVRAINADENLKTAFELQSAEIEYGYTGDDVDWHYDEFASRSQWDDMVEYMCDRFELRFPSFSRADRWKNRDKHIVLESKLFEVAVCDNEWSIAWMLLEKDIGVDEGSNLKGRYFDTYLKEIKDALIDGYGEAIGYGGAWTSGTRYTKAS